MILTQLFEANRTELRLFASNFLEVFSPRYLTRFPRLYSDVIHSLLGNSNVSFPVRFQLFESAVLLPPNLYFLWPSIFQLVLFEDQFKFASKYLQLEHFEKNFFELFIDSLALRYGALPEFWQQVREFKKHNDVEIEKYVSDYKNFSEKNWFSQKKDHPGLKKILALNCLAPFAAN